MNETYLLLYPIAILKFIVFLIVCGVKCNIRVYTVYITELSHNAGTVLDKQVRTVYLILFE